MFTLGMKLVIRDFPSKHSTHPLGHSHPIHIRRQMPPTQAEHLVRLVVAVAYSQGAAACMNQNMGYLLYSLTLRRRRLLNLLDLVVES
jgi:hypothetical protein